MEESEGSEKPSMTEKASMDSQVWGNSILFFNMKFWTCSYCGKLIKDKTRFTVVMINGNPHPYILCSQSCLKLQVLKIEALHQDKE